MIRKVALYLWQLPQNIVGLFVILFSRATYNERRGVWVTKRLFGVSLGNYIILSNRYLNDKDIKHEQGHQKQSIRLGWLYLLVIGLPSAIGNIVYRIHPFVSYKQPWEAWADKLGGVIR